MGNVWAGASVVSLSFNGDLTILDPRSTTPANVLHGHQGPVTALAADPSRAGTFFSGDATGRVLQVSDAGQVDTVKGGHAGLVVDIVSDGKALYSAAFDDTVRRLEPTSGYEFVYPSTCVAVGGAH